MAFLHPSHPSPDPSACSGLMYSDVPITCEVTNAVVCVDLRDTQIWQMCQDGNGVVRKMDATIGANLFVHVPILFHGKDSWLGILVP